MPQGINQFGVSWDHNDGDMPCCFILFDLAAKFAAVNACDQEVKQDQVGPQLDQLTDNVIWTRQNCYPETLGLKQVAIKRKQIVIVFHNEYVFVHLMVIGVTTTLAARYCLMQKFFLIN